MAVTFSHDILPLFRSGDIACMGGKGVALDDAAWMCGAGGDRAFPDHTNARKVFDQLARGSMPPDGAWSPERLALYEQWMADGFAP